MKRADKGAEPPQNGRSFRRMSEASVVEQLITLSNDVVEAFEAVYLFGEED